MSTYTPKDVLEYLIAQGVADASTSTDWPGFVDELPETQNPPESGESSRCITVRSDGSLDNLPSVDALRPFIKVLVRGKGFGESGWLESDFTDGYDKMSEVVENLTNVSNTRINGGTMYQMIELDTGPEYMGKDEVKRPVWMARFHIIRSQQNV